VIPSGKGGERFPPLPPPQNTGFWGGWGGADGDSGGALVGQAEERKGGWGEKGLAQAQDIDLVTPARMARQALPRRCMWCDRLAHISAPLAQRRVGPPAWQPCCASRSLPVAPAALARPNRLQGVNKTQSGLNLKYC
jgi:hypothetical protein